MKLLLIFALSITTLIASPIDQHENVKNSINTRIIGGSDAFVKDVPFMAAITVYTNNTQYFCGGTLINNLWVLTSGQCVYNAVLFKIQLGSNTLTGEDPNRVTLSTGTSVIHPEYDPLTFANDVGLIKFRLPITFTDYIKPIEYLLNYRLPSHMGYKILGWGQTSDDVAGESNHLQVVGILSTSDATCQQTYGEYATENIICVAGSYDQGTCFGDSGSPLFHLAFHGFGWVHAGIASFVRGNGCESPDPSAFSRTESYYNWIQSVAFT